MRRSILIVSLAVTFAFLAASMFTKDPTLLRKHRQPLSKRRPFGDQIYSQEPDYSSSLVGEQHSSQEQYLAQWKVTTGLERKDAVTPEYSPQPQTRNNNADDIKVESIKTILGRTDTTDPEWSKRVDICYTYERKKFPVSESLQKIGQCKKRLPVALVIGVKKCGTGTLSRYLDLHPAVSMSRETMIPGSEVNKDSIARWIQRMPLSSPYQLTMTENPGFFSYPTLWFLHFKPYLSPSAKFLVILRDPVDRAISDYLHRVDHSNTPKDQPFDMFHKTIRIRETFEKTILTPDGDIIESKLSLQGLYNISIETILQVYRRDQFMFIDGDAFAEDPYPTMLKVEEFLGLPKFYRRSHFVKNETKGFYCAQVPERPDFGCMIPSKGRPHPKISDDVLRKLRNYYRPYNKALVDQLGLNFSWIFK